MVEVLPRITQPTCYWVWFPFANLLITFYRNMQNFIGIDVSSTKLNIHFLLQSEDYVIPNNEKSILTFIKEHKLSKSSCLVGCESTGRYHLLCQKIFVENGFEFKVLNPILTNKKIVLSVRKKKTDLSDAKLIALLLSQGEGQKVTNEMLNTTRKTILRTRSTIVKHKTAMKILLQDLKKDPNNQELRICIEQIQDLIVNLEEAIKTIEAEVLGKGKESETEKLIKSIPGFAERLSAIVASEVGDFKRFPTSTQFKAFVGVDPRVKQSGTSTHTGKITKRGNVHLRSAFYLAAQVSRQHDPEIREFYEKKKAEGKPTRVAMIAVARKLCERVYAVVNRGLPYEVRQVAFV